MLSSVPKSGGVHVGRQGWRLEVRQDNERESPNKALLYVNATSFHTRTLYKRVSISLRTEIYLLSAQIHSSPPSQACWPQIVCVCGACAYETVAGS